MRRRGQSGERVSYLRGAQHLRELTSRFDLLQSGRRLLSLCESWGAKDFWLLNLFTNQLPGCAGLGPAFPGSGFLAVVDFRGFTFFVGTDLIVLRFIAFAFGRDLA